MGHFSLLFLFLLVSFWHQIQAEEPIVIGIVVEPTSTIAKNGLIQGIQSSTNGSNIQMRILVVDTAISPTGLCKQLIGQDVTPVTMMIDATQESGDRSQVSRVAKLVAETYAIPSITTSWGRDKESAWHDLNQWQQNMLLQVSPPDLLYLEVIHDLIVEQSLVEGVIIVDSTFPDHFKIRLKEVMTAERMVHPLVFMKNHDEADTIMGSLKKKKVTQIVVLGSIITMNRLADAGVTHSMIDSTYSWFLVTKSKGKVSCNRCISLDFLQIQPTLSTSREYNHSVNLNPNLNNPDMRLEFMFYYDLARSVMASLNEIQWPLKPQMTFPSCGVTNPKVTVEQIKERSRFLMGFELSQEGHYGRFGRFHFEDYQSTPSFQDIVMKMTNMDLFKGSLTERGGGEWAFSNGNHGQRFVYRKYVESSGVASKDKKSHLKIVMYEQEPFIMKYNIKNRNGKIKKPIVGGKEVSIIQHGDYVYYGYCIDLINLIRWKMDGNETDVSKKWPWTFEVYPQKENKFGVKDPKTGKWDGVIGEIADKKADIGLGPIAVMAERETVVDFTVPYYDLVGINILMKKPAVPSHLFKFLTVLEANVWFSILVGYFIVSIMVFLYDRYSPFSYYNDKEGWLDQKRRDFSFKESLWFCITSLTPQGGGEGPQNLSGRVVALTWWTFGFVVIAAYTANLAAFLTVSRLDSTMESLDHLSNQYRIEYATMENTEALVYFDRMSYIERKFYQIWKNMSLNRQADPADQAKFSMWGYPISDKYTKMIEFMHQCGMPKNYHEGVRRAKASVSAQEGFAWIADAVQVKFAIHTNCDLHSIGNEFSRKPIALVVQQNSTLKDRLSSAILKLLNERSLESLKEKWWSHFKKKCEDTKKSTDGISIHNIGGVFIVIFAGVILACITLAFEYVMLRAKKNAAKLAGLNPPQGYNMLKASNVLGRSYGGTAGRNGSGSGSGGQGGQ